MFLPHICPQITTTQTSKRANTIPNGNPKLIQVGSSYFQVVGINFRGGTSRYEECPDPLQPTSTALNTRFLQIIYNYVAYWMWTAGADPAVAVGGPCGRLPLWAIGPPRLRPEKTV